MISRRCSRLLTWCCSSIYQWIFVVVAVHLMFHSMALAKAQIIDDRRRQSVLLSTTTLEPPTNLDLPQADSAVVLTSQVPPRDHCAPFSNIDDDKKEFYSPGYPAGNYPNNSDCVVVLVAPEGFLIRLDFRDWFAIESSPDCKNDYLEVRDGRYGFNKLIERPFCGIDQFPPMITSTDRYLWVHFRSDENIEYKGFKAVFYFIKRDVDYPEIMPCYIELENLEEGFLGKKNISEEILNFDITNHMPIDCLWKIVVKESWRIHLQFKSFSLEKPNDCENNFIQVFSDKPIIPFEERKFCGSMADSVWSKNNVMYVRFFSESTGEKSTFEANFTAYRDNEKGSSTYIEGCDAETEFDCDDSTCISRTLKCNQRYNCRFRWDEDDCPSSETQGFSNDHITIIMVIFSLILSGMFFTFIYNCVRKLRKDHQTIQEYVRQSREQQLNELDKRKDPNGSINQSKNSTPSMDTHFEMRDSTLNTHCYVPGAEIHPILLGPKHQHSISSTNGDAPNQIYTVDSAGGDILPEMCDSACQTPESLFGHNTSMERYNSSEAQISPTSSVHNNSPPAPFSTFGYKKGNKFKAEARIEVGGQTKVVYEDKRRPFSVQTTKSAPDVIVTH